MISKHTTLILGIIILFTSLTYGQVQQPLASNIQSFNLEEVSAKMNSLEVTAIDYAFQAPEEVPAGWTKITFNNDGEYNHFMFMNMLPEGKTLDDYINEIAVPIDGIWKSLREGEISKPQAGKILGEDLPKWYGSLKPMGGPGIIQPGGTLEYTVNLKPGMYILECYMKTPEGEFHAMEGMSRELKVTKNVNQGIPPKADITLTLTNYDIAVSGDLTTGKKIVAVNFEEHPEVGFGHDIHLAKLDPETDIDNVAHWIDWLNVNGMVDPAPATFLGGTHEGPVGSTAYFEVELNSGRYLLISELTNPAGMVKEFTIE